MDKRLIAIIPVFLTMISMPALAEWTIDGDAVYINDSNVYIRAEPHTIRNSGWVYFNLTSKIYEGDIDVVWGFNTDEVRPTNALLYSPHEVNTTISYTCTEDYFNYTYEGKSHPDNHFWCWRNVTEYDEITNETIGWHYELIVDAWFEWGDVPSATAYWNIIRIEDYKNIAGLFQSIDYDFGGMNKWWYLKNVSIVKDTNYQVKSYIKVPLKIGDFSGKYWFAVKPSSETIEEAIASGHFYYLDPWWNETCSYYKNITISNTAGVSSITDYTPVIVSFNTSGHQTDGKDMQIIDSDANTISYGLQITGSDDFNLTFPVNFTSPTDSVTYSVYYGCGEDVYRNSSWDSVYWSLIYDDFNSDTIGSGFWTEIDPNNRFAVANGRLEFTGLSGNDGYVYHNITFYNFTYDWEWHVTDSTHYFCGAQGAQVDDAPKLFRSWTDGVGKMTTDNETQQRVTTWISGARTVLNSGAKNKGITYYERLIYNGTRVYYTAYNDSARTEYYADADLEFYPYSTKTFKRIHAINTYDDSTAGTGWVDNIKVRPWIETEPSYSISAEETSLPYISITWNYNSVTWTSLNHNTANNTAPNQANGIYNATVDTNANFTLQGNGTNPTGGSYSFSVSNLTVDSDTAKGSLAVGNGIPLTSSPQIIDTNIPYTTTTHYHGYWLSIPNQQYATDYSFIVTLDYSNV